MANGGKILDLPNSQNISGVYSEDGRYFIAVLSHQLRVHFISTRQCTRTVDFDFTNVVDLDLDPNNPSVIIAYKPSEVVRINWREKLQDPVVSRQVIEDLTSVVHHYDDDGLLYISQKNDNTSVIYRSPAGEYLTIYETTSIVNYAVSLNKHYLAMLNDNRDIINIDLTSYLTIAPTSESIQELSIDIKSFNYKSPIISMAVSDENLIALGSLSGPIQVIFNDENDNEKILKWHIGPAKCLKFHQNFLLSGGDEKVLVIWQIDDDKTQFLPRLNGVINKVSIDVNKPDHYNLALDINGISELLILSSVDLVSRLTVNSIRPNLKKKTTFKNSTSLVSINPKSNHLYLPNESNIQVYDLVKNEQVYHQTVSSVVSMGKVKSETKLMDPVVTQLAFTEDGEWMCTFDMIKGNDVDNLLSQDDTNYALKFWKYPTNASGWELVTKIINPHLTSPVAAVLPYQNGFITADTHGNLRYWKSKNKAWALVKTFELAKLDSRSVDLTKSEDSSLIVLAHENVVYLLNSNLSLVQNLLLVELSIRSVELVENNLVILSKTKFVSFDLVNFKFHLAAKVNVAAAKSYLVSNRGIVALSLNNESSNKSRIMLFRSDTLKPIFSFDHDCYVNSISAYNDGFLFVDNQLRIGVITNSELKLAEETEITDLKVPVAPISSSNGDVSEYSFKNFDLNSFNNIFETDNLESLFDNIVKIVK